MKMTFCKMKMKTRDCTFILQNENENVRMEINSFHNETEMSSAGRGPKMTFAK